MRLINRGNQQSPLARQACDIALAAHQQRYGDYGRSKMKETYTVKVEGVEGLGGGGEPQGELCGHGNDRHAPLACPSRPGVLIKNYQTAPVGALGERR